MNIENKEKEMREPAAVQEPEGGGATEGATIDSEPFGEHLTSVEEIAANNEDVDPNWHEAICQQESAEVTEGQVLQQERKCYKLRDRLLRPASVVVAKNPAV